MSIFLRSMETERKEWSPFCVDYNACAISWKQSNDASSIERGLKTLFKKKSGIACVALVKAFAEGKCKRPAQRILIPQTFQGNRKEIVREVARGDEHYLRKSADRKAQISNALVQISELICALRSADVLR